MDEVSDAARGAKRPGTVLQVVAKRALIWPLFFGTCAAFGTFVFRNLSRALLGGALGSGDWSPGFVFVCVWALLFFGIVGLGSRSYYRARSKYDAAADDFANHLAEPVTFVRPNAGSGRQTVAGAERDERSSFDRPRPSVLVGGRFGSGTVGKAVKDDA